MWKVFRRFCRCNDGLTAIEYAAIASIVSIAALGAFAILGDTVNEHYSEMADEVVDATQK